MPKLQHQPLKYKNESFAIHHLIEDCPSHTVIRELLKNAEEAASRLKPPGRIEWFSEEIGGSNKLGLFNEGPGMSDDDLRELMDMASTGKTLGVDNNFGQGGKVSGLKVSPAGLVYRSCKDGYVHEIILAAMQVQGSDHPVYVKRMVPIPCAPFSDTVIDVTEKYLGRADRPLDKEWTEVVLIGKREDQDTLAELLPDAKKRTNWLIRQINQRFFRFPKGIVVRNADATSGQRNARNAQGLEYHTLNECRDEGRTEDVRADHPAYGPVTIRYCKLRGSAEVDSVGNSRARTMEAYGIGSRGDHVCVVWRDECYEMTTGWSRISGPFGVTFGSANVAVQILLPDDTPVKNNTYRDKLLRRADSGRYVSVEEFADLVFQHRPQWLIDYVEEEARRTNTGSNVMDRLRQYLQDMLVQGSNRSLVEPGGQEEGERPGGEKGNPEGGGGGRPEIPTHRPARGRRTDEQASGIPVVQFTNDTGILAEMGDRAASYRRPGMVLLNPNHSRYQQSLRRILEAAGPDSEKQQIARRLFEDEYMVQAGKFVIQAWLFRSQGWDDTQFEEALSMGAMTVYLASPDALDEANRKYRQRMMSSRVEAAASS